MNIQQQSGKPGKYSPNPVTTNINYLPLLFILAGFLATFGFISCGSSGEETNGDAESIREQISEYNERITQLNQQVDSLENQLEEMGEYSNNQRRTPVTLVEVEKQPFEHYIQVNANVEAVTEATISPEINGQIKTIEVSRGERVQPGQIVVKLNTSVIESNIEEIRTNLELAETVFNRQKSLWDQEIGSEIQFLEAQNNLKSLNARLNTLESQLAMAVIRSPIKGVVDDIFVKEGELAMPGAPLLQIINLDQLYVNADVSESYLPVISSGDEVILRFPAYPDYEQEVNIHRLGNVINPENRTFPLRLRINNQENRFKPNMTATIGIRTFFADSAIVVPSILIKQDTQGYFVYVASENEQNNIVANKVYIEREMDSEGSTMISSGLEVGDRVIRQGHNRVNDGERIEVSDR